MLRLKLAGGVFVLAAIAMLGWCGYALSASRQTRSWSETTCTVTNIELRRGAARKQRHTRYLDITYSYTANGTRYSGDQWNAAESRLHTTNAAPILKQFSVGSTHACWFDPNDPQTAVLDRGAPSAVLWLPWLSVTFGAIGLWILRKTRA